MSKQERLLNYLWPRSEYLNGKIFKIQKWRSEILKRDCNKCQTCNNSIEDIYRRRQLANEAHHIIPRHHSGKNTLSNGVTLCHFCHDYFDQMYFSHGLDYHDINNMKKKYEIIQQVKNMMYIKYMRRLEHEIAEL